MRKLDGLKGEGGRAVSGHAPDDDDDAVKDIVGVPQVLKEAKGGELQDHLQREHAGENDVADLQDVGQFVGLKGRRERNPEKNLLRLKSILEETE